MNITERHQRKPDNFEEQIRSLNNELKKRRLLFFWLTIQPPQSDKITQLENWQPPTELTRKFKQLDTIDNVLALVSDSSPKSSQLTKAFKHSDFPEVQIIEVDDIRNPKKPPKYILLNLSYKTDAVIAK